MKRYDLSELRNNLSEEAIIRIMFDLGSPEYKETDEAIIFKTICHNCSAEDASMKLYYYKNTKRFHCYTDCGENFDIIELFKKRYNLLGIKYNFYEDIILKISRGEDQHNHFHYSSEKLYNSPFQIKEPIKLKQEFNYEKINESLLNSFIFYPTPEWLSEGISEETMRKYNILYSLKENKIIIPHYDKNGKLIGVRGRTLEKEEEKKYGKYMPVTIEGKMYSHLLSYNLYGLNLVKENLKKKKTAIIAESEKACMQYNTMFGEKQNICVSSCGNKVNIFQINLLLDLGVSKIIIAFDKEGKTWEEKEKNFNKMKKMCEKYKMLCQIGFIFDTRNLLKNKQSPFDRGKEITKILLSKVVWI